MCVYFLAASRSDSLVDYYYKLENYNTQRNIHGYCILHGGLCHCCQLLVLSDGGCWLYLIISLKSPSLVRRNASFKIRKKHENIRNTYIAFGQQQCVDQHNDASRFLVSNEIRD